MYKVKEKAGMLISNGVEYTEKQEVKELSKEQVKELLGLGVIEEGKGTTPKSPLEDLKLDELKAKATELGIAFKAIISKKDLIALIEEKEKNVV